jgi:hypothetical protein
VSRVPTLLAGALTATLALGASRADAQYPPTAPGPGFAPPSPMPGMGPPGMPHLVLPAPPPPTPAQIATVAWLDRAEREDSGRRLTWLWFDVAGGFEQLGMQTFNGGDQGFAGGLLRTSASGGVVSVGAGARLLYLTLLLRGRVGVFDSGVLYRVGPEVGFHVPLGSVEPHAALGLGYAAVGDLKDTVGGVAAADIALRGFYARGDAGLDYYPTPAFSIGADLSAELLGLFRPALTAAEVTVISASPTVPASLVHGVSLLSSSGTGWGGTIALTGVAGLHF